MPSVFSFSKNLQSKQSPGILEIKGALSLCYEWEDEEQKKIGCLAESLLGDKQSCCPELCSPLLTVTDMGSPCLLWLNVRAKAETTPGIPQEHVWLRACPPFTAFILFHGVYLTCNSIPHVCQLRLRPLTCDSREIIYFKFFNSVLQLEMRRSQN